MTKQQQTRAADAAIGLVESLTEQHKINLDKPFAKLTAKQQKTVLYGTGAQRVLVPQGS